MHELVCHIMVALAQSERKTIATRIRDALRQAKLRGVKLGGPNIAEARLLANSARTTKAKEQNEKLRLVIQETRQKTGLTKLADIAESEGLALVLVPKPDRNGSHTIFIAEENTAERCFEAVTPYRFNLESEAVKEAGEKLRMLGKSFYEADFHFRFHSDRRDEF